MSFLFDVNTRTATGAETVYKLKTLLKSVGWTVPSSSDGTTYNSSGDQITTGSSGAGGMANSNSWYRIQDPLGVRELIIQRGTTNLVYKVKYSGTAKFTGGAPSASVIPTATDEQFLLGSLGSFATWFPADSTYRVHVAASNGDGYGFYMAAISFGVGANSNSGACLVLDPMINGSYSGLDQDPCILYLRANATMFGAEIYGASAVGRGWIKKNLAGEGWVAIAGCNLRSGSDVVFPSGAGTNPITGKIDAIPIFWCRRNSEVAPVGAKGIGSIMKWHSIDCGNGQTFTVDSTSDRIVFGLVNLPWNGSTVIL